jgi:hypothetical protein
VEASRIVGWGRCRHVLTDPLPDAIHRCRTLPGERAESDDAARPQHAPRLGQRTPWVGEEEEAEPTEHGIEGIVGERQFLRIGDERLRVADVGPLDHGPQFRHHARGEVDANHATGGADAPGRGHQGRAGTGCDVEYTLTRPQPSTLHQQRPEMCEQSADAVMSLAGSAEQPGVSPFVQFSPRCTYCIGKVSLD